MMGDNRDNSRDSRFHGIVKREQIVGEAKRVLLSFDLNNWLKPRLPRFGEALSIVAIEEVVGDRFKANRLLP